MFLNFKYYFNLEKWIGSNKMVAVENLCNLQTYKKKRASVYFR